MVSPGQERTSGQITTNSAPFIGFQVEFGSFLTYLDDFDDDLSLLVLFGSISIFELKKGLVALDTNSQAHSTALPQAPLGTLVKGCENDLSY